MSRGDAVNDRVYRAPIVAALHSPSGDGRPDGRPMSRGDAVNDRVDRARAFPTACRKTGARSRRLPICPSAHEDRGARVDGVADRAGCDQRQAAGERGAEGEHDRVAEPPARAAVGRARHERREQAG